MGAEDEGEEGLTEYEKQRLNTIAKNKAVLASLGLPALASSLAKPTSVEKAKGKQKQPVARVQGRRSERVKTERSTAIFDDSSSSEHESDSDSGSSPPSRKRKLKDQEYEPSDEEGSQSDSEEDLEDQDMEETTPHTYTPAIPNDLDLDEEELALQQALALSLGTSLEEVAAEGTTFSRKEKTKRSTRGSTPASLASAFEKLDDPPSPAGPSKVDRTPKQGKQKRNKIKVHFTEGDIDALFSLFDGRGRGHLTAADIERVSIAHDFTWSKEELREMIDFFDSNHDGQAIWFGMLVVTLLEGFFWGFQKGPKGFKVQGS